MANEPVLLSPDQIRIMSLKAGDTVVLTVKHNLDDAQVHRLRQTMLAVIKQSTPDLSVGCVVLCCGVEMSVLRAGEQNG